LKAIVASDLEKITDDMITVAMKNIFSELEINELDIADGLKQLLYKKKYDLNTILQFDAVSLAGELGIEEYVGKIIIDAAKRKVLE
jgi:glycine cleavage system protein P-like pyridoxal-binding family